MQNCNMNALTIKVTVIIFITFRFKTNTITKVSFGRFLKTGHYNRSFRIS